MKNIIVIDKQMIRRLLHQNIDGFKGSLIIKKNGLKRMEISYSGYADRYDVVLDDEQGNYIEHSSSQSIEVIMDNIMKLAKGNHEAISGQIIKNNKHLNPGVYDVVITKFASLKDLEESVSELIDSVYSKSKDDIYSELINIKSQIRLMKESV